MAKFLSFIWDCIALGATWGFAVFGIIETVSAIVWGLLKWRRTKLPEGKIQYWEDIVSRTAALVFAGAFLISTVFVAPFIKTTESQEQRDWAMNKLDQRERNPMPQRFISEDREHRDKTESQFQSLSNRVEALTQENERLLTSNNMLSASIGSVNPMNQPLASIVATADVKIKGGINWDQVKDRMRRLRFQTGGDVGLPFLKIGESGWETNQMNTRHVTLHCVDMTFVGGGSQATFFLRFAEPRFFGKGRMPENTTVDDLLKMPQIHIDSWVNLLSPETEVVGGELEITINGSVKRKYPIPKLFKEDGHYYHAVDTNRTQAIVVPYP